MYWRRVTTAIKIFAAIWILGSVLYMILGLFSWMFPGLIIPLDHLFSTGWTYLESASVIYFSADFLEHPRRFLKLLQFACYQMTDEQEEKEKLLEKMDRVMRAIENDKVSPARLQELGKLFTAIQGELER